MKNLDDVWSIYQEFLDSVDRHLIVLDAVTALQDGKEKAILKFSNGFTLELFNDPKKENGACIHCWRDNKKEKIVNISSLEQLNCFYTQN